MANSLTSSRIAAAALALAGVATAAPASAAGFCAAVAPNRCSYSGIPRASMVLVAAEGPWTLSWACAVSGTRTTGGNGPRLLLRAHSVGELCTVDVSGTAVVYAGPAPLDRIPIDE